MSTVVEPNTSLVETTGPIAEKKNAPLDFPALFARIVNVTQELFPGEVSASLLDDPEYPQDRYVVFEAKASCLPEEAVQRQLEWHRRVSELHESCWDLSLTLDFRK